MEKKIRDNYSSGDPTMFGQLKDKWLWKSFLPASPPKCVWTPQSACKVHGRHSNCILTEYVHKAGQYK